MARKVFFSFHYQEDAWRVSQVRNIGAIEGQRILGSNDWEDVANGGDPAIKKWINEQMAGKSVNVVLIGAHTAGRKWVNYEFTKAWSDGKGVLGIHIHRLLDGDRLPTTKGANPFSGFTLGQGADNVDFDSIVPVYNPTGVSSSDVYNDISSNIEAWCEHAIAIRKNR